jgi:hypothetical protein
VVPLGELPFSVADLEEAIAERQVESTSRSPSGDLVVRAVGAHTFELVFDRKRCQVDIEEQEPESVVRLVALNAVDLFLAEPVPAAPRVKRERPRGSVAARGSSTHARFVLAPELGHGLGSNETTTYAVVAQASLHASSYASSYASSGVFFGSVGWWQCGAVDQESGASVAMRALPFRLGVGVAIGPAEVGLAFMALPYQLSEVTRHSGALLGGSANAALPFTIGDGVRLVVSAGLDAFANRVAVRRADGQVTFASPRFAPWVGLGLAWEASL